MEVRTENDQKRGKTATNTEGKRGREEGGGEKGRERKEGKKGRKDRKAYL